MMMFQYSYTEDPDVDASDDDVTDDGSDDDVTDDGSMSTH